MFRLLAIIFTGIIVSLFYFPLQSYLPMGMNTKMCLAVIGLILGVVGSKQNKGFEIPDNVLKLIVISVLVSLVGYISVVYNGTSDFAYATYVVSMLVWFSAAYSVCFLIRTVHSSVSIELISKYLIGVCVFQCIIAQLIDASPAINTIAKYIMNDNKAWVESVNRIYGIGAELDTAGIRFSIALVMTAFLLTKERLNSRKWWLYSACFVVITVLGSMIARTTYVGTIVGLMYALIVYKPWLMKLNKSNARFLLVLLLVVVICIVCGVYLYKTDVRIYKLSRFAFEGFFNLVEKDEWSIASNNKLNSMIVFPETMKTWIIGDGYCSNPIVSDPYFIGKYISGWYMGTDIGYLRFIFYFGIIGLIVFSYFMCYAAKVCLDYLPGYKDVILMCLLVGFVCWTKVSTDVWLVFALFICVANMQSLEQEQIVENSSNEDSV